MAARWSMDRDWRFFRGDMPQGMLPSADDAAWELVSLPHTGRTEKIDCSGQRNYLGILWYRKRFFAVPEWHGKRVFLHFGGAKHVAEVWLDGRKIGTHLGGYLPFSYDITESLACGGEHVLAVRLDNTDHGDIPPGKPQDNLDFCYHSGLYRHAWLEVCGETHIDDEAGSVYVSYPEVNELSARVRVQARVRHEGEKPARVSVRCLLQGAAEARSESFILYQRETFLYELEMEVPYPRLWSPDAPHLYPLRISVYADDVLTDEREMNVGIRRFRFDNEGFFLNGQALMLNGANKHQEYPYIGDALPDSLHWRDVRKLKALGFNFIRPGHYPHAEAFFDACDALGMTCVVPTPGWQWFVAEGPFRERCYDNIRQMVPWLRNHPCVILWEPILNETEYDEAFAREAYRIVHECMPGDQCYAACDGHLPGGDFYDVAYAERDRHHRPKRALFLREYGDNYVEGYGRMKTLRRVSRGDRGFYEGGDDAMTRSALERMLVLSRLKRLPSLAGLALWTGMDHNRAYMDNISGTGVLDLCRIPKHSAYMYASQRKSEEEIVLYPCTSWAAAPQNGYLVVFTNCEEVEARMNGSSLGRKKPSFDFVNDPERLLAVQKNPDQRMMDGLDFSREGVAHPPVFFPIENWQPGLLELTGYINGQAVARCARRTPEPACRLLLEADDEGLPLIADGADVMMIRIRAVDAHDTVDPSCYNEVTLHVSGAACALTPREYLEAGEVGLLIQSTATAGEICVLASCGGLACEPLKLISRAANDRPVPAPLQQPPTGPFHYDADEKVAATAFQILRTNAALNAAVTASSFEAGHEPEMILDPLLTTWWKAADDGAQWLLLDLRETMILTGFQLGWLKDNAYYEYAISVSEDGINWEQVAKNRVTGHSRCLDDIGEKRARYVRVDIAACSGQRAEMIRFSAMRKTMV